MASGAAIQKRGAAHEANLVLGSSRSPTADEDSYAAGVGFGLGISIAVGMARFVQSCDFNGAPPHHMKKALRVNNEDSTVFLSESHMFFRSAARLTCALMTQVLHRACGLKEFHVGNKASARDAEKVQVRKIQAEKIQVDKMQVEKILDKFGQVRYIIRSARWADRLHRAPGVSAGREEAVSVVRAGDVGAYVAVTIIF